jgi:transposase
MTFVKKIKKKSGVYLCEVEGYRDEQGKVKHRFIRSLGKLDEEGNVVPRMKIENVKVERVRLQGPVHVLHKITELLELEDLLGRYAPEVLTLVYSHILRAESLNNIDRVLSWIDTDEIGLELPVSRKRFESAMDHVEPKIQYIEREIYRKIKDHCNLQTLFYDITEIYFYGTHVWMANPGYSPQHNQLPQIGIGLAVEAQYGIPLFHHLFEGNVFDSRTFPVILNRLQEIEREGCTLVFDRGVSSRENIQEAQKCNFSVIACLALRGRIRAVAVEESQNLEVTDIVKLSEIFIHAREIQQEMWGELFRFIICLNKPLQQEIQQHRYYEITDAAKRLEEGLKIKKGLQKYLKEEGKGGEIHINYEALKEREKYDGLYVIITTTDLPKEKVIQKYFEKDRIEKSFRSLKSSLSIRPVRHWLNRRVRAHVFICYLAYLHLSWVEMLLRENGLFISAVKALQQLETIYTVSLIDKETGMSTTRTVPLTKEQEKIYKALKLLS